MSLKILRIFIQPVTRFNDLLQDDVNWENALSKGISFNDLDESQGNRTRNSLKDAFDELQVIFSRLLEMLLLNKTEICCPEIR